MMRWPKLGGKRPTLLLRCLLLIAAELAVNALLWIVAAIVFRQRPRFLTLCLLAWTLGLRHALDADHISVIDNATRRIVSLSHTDSLRPRRPVTCGLWFSLGHSTIVVAVICAIAISLGIVDRLGRVSSVGGVIGAAVSGSTLFLFAVVNSVLLYQSIAVSRRHRKASFRNTQQASTPNTSPSDEENMPTKAMDADEEPMNDSKAVDHRFRGIFTRIAYPLFQLVDRPYKLYPVGVLFGLGFDTASSIALLGIAGATNTQVQDTDLGSGDNILPADATRRSDASIVLLALLFTAGMTLVDSLDSVLMINAYAPGELFASRSEGARGGWSWWKRARFLEDASQVTGEKSDVTTSKVAAEDDLANDGTSERGTGSMLSQLLTLLSILLAFAISIITLMGLIGENCDRCARAASKQDDTHDGGLEGRWWLFWQQANDASGIIGACIVGGFAAILVVWYAGRAIVYRHAQAPQ
jgi:high-affinity nickel-transport protein